MCSDLLLEGFIDRMDGDDIHRIVRLLPLALDVRPDGWGFDRAVHWHLQSLRLAFSCLTAAAVPSVGSEEGGLLRRYATAMAKQVLGDTESWRDTALEECVTSASGGRLFRYHERGYGFDGRVQLWEAVLKVLGLVAVQQVDLLQVEPALRDTVQVAIQLRTASKQLKEEAHRVLENASKEVTMGFDKKFSDLLGRITSLTSEERVEFERARIEMAKESERLEKNSRLRLRWELAVKCLGAWQGDSAKERLEDATRDVGLASGDWDEEWNEEAMLKMDELERGLALHALASDKEARLNELTREEDALRALVEGQMRGLERASLIREVKTSTREVQEELDDFLDLPELQDLEEDDRVWVAPRSSDAHLQVRASIAEELLLAQKAPGPV